MTDISISVEHSTTVQHPSIHNRTDEDSKIIPSNRIHDSITNNDILRQNLGPSKRQILILVCTFILFTIISMTIGIITVCLTSPDRKRIFSYIS
jgi:hypothetical protein